jgi:vacuolar-type H+-ATPase subunit B/Vma2
MASNVLDAVKQIIALYKDGKNTEEAVTFIYKSMSDDDRNWLQEALEISLAKSYMDRKLLKRDQAGWNMVKHRKGQVLAMAA